MSETFSNAPPAEVVTPCPYASSTPPHWVELEVIGENKIPIPWLAYQVTLADGTVIDGYLDEAGFARLEGIQQGGTCKVTFPELDKDCWFFVETVSAKAKSN